MKKKILVTGATGFIGSYCLKKLLRHGFEVYAVTKNRTTPSLNQNINWYMADLFDKDNIRNMMEKISPSYLLHCAWVTTPGIFWNSPENLRWLESTYHLLNYFGQFSGTRAVGLGSCAEYDWDIGGVCSERTTPLLPKSIYGQCKLAASQVFSAASQVYGFSYSWGRLFFPFGPKEPSNKFISSVIMALKRKTVIQCASGELIRDFLHVEDIADALVTMIMSEEQGTYNLGSGKPLSIKNIVDEITKELGGEELIKLGSRTQQEGEPKVLVADMEQFYQKFRWRPKIDLGTGIQGMIKVLCL